MLPTTTEEPSSRSFLRMTGIAAAEDKRDGGTDILAVRQVSGCKLHEPVVQNPKQTALPDMGFGRADRDLILHQMQGPHQLQRAGSGRVAERSCSIACSDRRCDGGWLSVSATSCDDEASGTPRERNEIDLSP